jgi:nicotinamidase/pyrazinamidase
VGMFDSKTALIIADMINDFVEPDGKLYVPGIEEIVPALADLIDQAHAAGSPVVFVDDAHEPDDIEFQQWGEHAVIGTRGSLVYKDLGPAEQDHVLEKTKYTVWYKTGLDRLLAPLDIDHVVITGTVTNICIFVSAVEALMRGYSVTVPRDAVKGLNVADHENALDQLSRVFGAEVI